MSALRKPFEQIATLGEVVRRCGVTRQTLLSWRERRGFPQGFEVHARCVMFLKNDVEAWLRANEPARAASGQGSW